MCLKSSRFDVWIDRVLLSNVRSYWPPEQSALVLRLRQFRAGLGLTPGNFYHLIPWPATSLLFICLCLLLESRIRYGYITCLCWRDYRMGMLWAARKVIGLPSQRCRFRIAFLCHSWCDERANWFHGVGITYRHKDSLKWACFIHEGARYWCSRIIPYR